jgi:hypothetical protein
MQQNGKIAIKSVQNGQKCGAQRRALARDHILRRASQAIFSISFIPFPRHSCRTRQQHRQSIHPANPSAFLRALGGENLLVY